jgi:hypothetical protein
MTVVDNLDAGIDTGEPAAMAIAFAYVGLAAVGLPAYLATVITFCIWVVRANRNVRALGAQGLQFTPGWCAGWFFVPIANLFKPYQAVREVYRASDPAADARDWKHVTAGLVGWWWAAYILSNFIGHVEFRMSMSNDPSVARGSAVVGLMSSPIGIAAALLCLAVVRSIHARQEAKAARVDVPTSPYAAGPPPLAG